MTSSTTEVAASSGRRSPGLLETLPPQAAPQQSDLTQKIKSTADDAFYKVYTFFVPIPKNGEPFELIQLGSNVGFETARPIPYTEAMENIQKRKDYYKRIGSPEEEAFSPQAVKCFSDTRFARPEFRKEQARWLLQAELDLNPELNTEDGKQKAFWTRILCDEEYHALSSEFKEKFDKALLEAEKWFFKTVSLTPVIYQDDIDKEHRESWDKMTSGERVKKICTGGERSRYALAVAGTSLIATTVFFLGHVHAVLS